MPVRTPLFDLHVELGGKMVPFAGYELPVQYSGGIIHEHVHTRTAAGLFDVSHMGQVRMSGAGAAAALEQLAPVDAQGLAQNHMSYALFTDDNGGILDDFMVSRADGGFFLVVNAACKNEDSERLRARSGPDCAVEDLSDRALLALQGPAAAQVMARVSPDATELAFMTAGEFDLTGVKCLVSRSGYTGEDGFEISLPAEHAEALARRLLAEEEVAPVGLGARDTLRLEAGLRLYGQDLGPETTPVQAGLVWTLSRARRPGGERAGGFPGAEVVFHELANGAARRFVGFLPEGRAPVRSGTRLTDAEDRDIGTVTSGGFGPTLGGPLAMGYVSSEHRKPNTPIRAIVRGKPLPGRVVKLPFVERNYHRS
jgi:aminomethyltransferase